MQVNSGGTMTARILIVDDELPITRLISTILGSDICSADISKREQNNLTGSRLRNNIPHYL